MTAAFHRARSNFLDWRTLATGLLCIGGFAAGTLVTASTAVDRYGWGGGLLIGWLVGPVVGGAVALVVFLWLLPLQPPARPPCETRSREADDPPAAPVAYEPSISLVMPVFNGRRFLQRSLPPLAAMLRRGDVLELIVVDEGSLDGSAELAAAYGATVVRPVARLGVGAARNLGAERALGDLIWFVDPEAAAYPDSPSRIRRAFREDGVVAVFGSYDAKPPELNFGSMYKNLLLHHRHQTADAEASGFWSGCGAVTREALLKVGGFDVAKYRSPSIEDVELGCRLRAAGGKIRLDRDFLAVALKRWSMAQIVGADILQRALPWRRLMMERHEFPASLHVSGSERLRAGLAVGVLVALAAAVAGLAPLWAPALLSLTALTTNWRLFQTFYGRGGLLFALPAIAFHQLYYVYSAAVFGACWAEAKFPRPVGTHPRLASHHTPDGSALA